MHTSEPPSLPAAVTLLVGYAVGCNIDRIARITGCGRGHVAKLARRWYDNGVWPARRPLEEFELHGLCDAFWRDVAVGEGTLYRRVNEAGEVEWGEPGRWWKSFDYVARSTEENRPVTYFAATEPLPGDALIAELIAGAAEAEAAELAAAQKGRGAAAPASPLPAPFHQPEWTSPGWTDTVQGGVIVLAAPAPDAGTGTEMLDHSPTSLFPDADWLS